MRVKLEQKETKVPRAVNVLEQQSQSLVEESLLTSSVTASLIRLQRRHGNQFVQSLLGSATLRSRCNCPPSGSVAEECEGCSSTTLSNPAKLSARDDAALNRPPISHDVLPRNHDVLDRIYSAANLSYNPASTPPKRDYGTENYSYDSGTATLFSTGEGTETVKEATADASAATNGCRVTGSFTSIPSGTLAATLSGAKLGASFSMVGTFSPSVPCTCSGGEYRQYVNVKEALRKANEGLTGAGHDDELS